MKLFRRHVLLLMLDDLNVLVILHFLVLAPSLLLLGVDRAVALSLVHALVAAWVVGSCWKLLDAGDRCELGRTCQC